MAGRQGHRPQRLRDLPPVLPLLPLLLPSLLGAIAAPAARAHLQQEAAFHSEHLAAQAVQQQVLPALLPQVLPALLPQDSPWVLQPAAQHLVSAHRQRRAQTVQVFLARPLLQGLLVEEEAALLSVGAPLARGPQDRRLEALSTLPLPSLFVAPSHLAIAAQRLLQVLGVALLVNTPRPLPQTNWEILIAQ